MRGTLTTIATVAALAFALTGCTGEATPGPTVTVTAAGEPEPAVTVTVEATVTVSPEPGAEDGDPYEVYLENNPDPDLVLSREDAQTRAMLGCETEWAPGTVDAVLQDAYADLCA